MQAVNSHAGISHAGISHAGISHAGISHAGSEHDSSDEGTARHVQLPPEGHIGFGATRTACTAKALKQLMSCAMPL